MNNINLRIAKYCLDNKYHNISNIDVVIENSIIKELDNLDLKDLINSNDMCYDKIVAKLKKLSEDRLIYDIADKIERNVSYLMFRFKDKRDLIDQFVESLEFDLRLELNDENSKKDIKDVSIEYLLDIAMISGTIDKIQIYLE